MHTFQLGPWKRGLDSQSNKPADAPDSFLELTNFYTSVDGNIKLRPPIEVDARISGACRGLVATSDGIKTFAPKGSTVNNALLFDVPDYCDLYNDQYTWSVLSSGVCNGLPWALIEHTIYSVSDGKTTKLHVFNDGAEKTYSFDPYLPSYDSYNQAIGYLNPPVDSIGPHPHVEFDQVAADVGNSVIMSRKDGSIAKSGINVPRVFDTRSIDDIEKNGKIYVFKMPGSISVATIDGDAKYYEFYIPVEWSDVTHRVDPTGKYIWIIEQYVPGAGWDQVSAEYMGAVVSSSGTYQTYQTNFQLATLVQNGTKTKLRVLARFVSQYEWYSVTIVSGGTGYTVGDSVTFPGSSYITSSVQVTVSSVLAGVVTGVTLVGSVRTNTNTLTSMAGATGGTGTGLVLRTSSTPSEIYDTTNFEGSSFRVRFCLKPEIEIVSGLTRYPGIISLIGNGVDHTFNTTKVAGQLGKYVIKLDGTTLDDTYYAIEQKSDVDWLTFRNGLVKDKTQYRVASATIATGGSDYTHGDVVSVAQYTADGERSPLFKVVIANQLSGGYIPTLEYWDPSTAGVELSTIFNGDYGTQFKCTWVISDYTPDNTFVRLTITSVVSGGLIPVGVTKIRVAGVGVFDITTTPSSGAIQQLVVVDAGNGSTSLGPQAGVTIVNVKVANVNAGGALCDTVEVATANEWYTGLEQSVSQAAGTGGALDFEFVVLSGGVIKTEGVDYSRQYYGGYLYIKSITLIESAELAWRIVPKNTKVIQLDPNGVVLTAGVIRFEGKLYDVPAFADTIRSSEPFVVVKVNGDPLNRTVECSAVDDNDIYDDNYRTLVIGTIENGGIAEFKYDYQVNSDWYNKKHIDNLINYSRQLETGTWLPSGVSGPVTNILSIKDKVLITYHTKSILYSYSDLFEGINRLDEYRFGTTSPAVALGDYAIIHTANGFRGIGLNTYNFDGLLDNNLGAPLNNLKVTPIAVSYWPALNAYVAYCQIHNATQYADNYKLAADSMLRTATYGILTYTSSSENNLSAWSFWKSNLITNIDSIVPDPDTPNKLLFMRSEASGTTRVAYAFNLDNTTAKEIPSLVLPVDWIEARWQTPWLHLGSTYTSKRIQHIDASITGMMRIDIGTNDGFEIGPLIEGSTFEDSRIAVSANCRLLSLAGSFGLDDYNWDNDSIENGISLQSVFVHYNLLGR